MCKNFTGFDNICIVGTGAIGGAFGGFLSDAGYEVTFIEEDKNIISKIKENGLSLSGVNPLFGDASTHHQKVSRWHDVFHSQ